MKTVVQIAGVLALLIASSSQSLSIPALGARHPALNADGSRLAFDWRGDIWIVPIEGGKARRLTDHVAHDAYPRWSPDNKEIAFSSDRHGNFDVFVVALDGGAPERLTFHSDSDVICDWSPDGQTIYFESRRESLHNLIYAVPRNGGRPVRITGDMAMNAAISPDGRWLAYVRGYTNWWRKHYRGPASRDIWVRPLGGGESCHLVSWEGDDDRPQWSSNSHAIFFQSEREDGVMNLYCQDFEVKGDRVEPTGSPVKLTHLTEDGIQFLSLSRDACWAAFELTGGIHVVSTRGGEPRKVEIDCPGDLKENRIERCMLDSSAAELAFAPGEKEIAFVVEGEIYAALVKNDGLKDAIRLTESDSREKDVAWLDEHTLLYVSDRHGDDDIFLMRSTDEKEPRLGKSRYREELRLTDSPETERWPRISPDGKTVLYTRGTGFLWTMQPDGRDQKLLLDEPQVLHSDWSPDSRYMAYSITTLGHAEDIFIFDRESRETVNVSNHPNDDFHPLWTDDGKRLSWASRTDDGFYSIKYLWLTHAEADKSEAEREREEEAEEEDKTDEEDNQKDNEKDADKDKQPIPEVKIDWDDITGRLGTVTTVRGYYWDYDASPDGKHYALRTDVVEEMELWTVDWDGDHLRRMTRGGVNPRRMLWSEDGEKVRYLSEGRIQEIKNQAGASPITLSFSAELTIDAGARRRQKFHEAWRLLNDGFYDENFHGTDWPAMRAKYEPLAAVAIMTEDFNDVLRQMIGELNASHLGVYGPWRGGGDRTGLLGFAPDDTYEGPGVRIAAVLNHGPLDREGCRAEPGEVILAIGGHEIGAGDNYYGLLNHKVGKEVDLVIAKDGQGRKKRIITVEPAGGGRIWDLSYKHWMDENRSRVDELAGGRLGYLHMSAMGDHDWDQFVVDIFSKARGREGLILDIRNNDGGSTHDRVLTFLSRRAYCYSQSRGERDLTYNARWRWDGPIVLLTNERSYSDGEIFPWGFKALELGTIVGMPTFGAVIGTNDVELIDGTGFRVPGTGWFRMDGRNMENDPIQPHILVPDVPEENLRGRDAQLEAGVEECLRILATR